MLFVLSRGFPPARNNRTILFVRPVPYLKNAAESNDTADHRWKIEFNLFGKASECFRRKLLQRAEMSSEEDHASARDNSDS